MAKAELSPEPNPGLGGLPQPHVNTQHGVYSKVQVIRALLPPDEAAVWDAAPVPADCTEILEEVFREYCVLKFRVHAWELGQAAPGAARRPPKDIAALSAVLRAYHITLRGLIKATEVHARMKEAEQTSDMGDAVLAYLRTLPAHRLETYMLQDEAPRFDPVSGRLLTDVSRETEEIADADRDSPGPGRDDGTPDPGGPGP